MFRKYCQVILWLWPIIFLTACSSHSKSNLPDGFVYLKDIDSSIQQNIRYASNNNFIGHKITGYGKASCILTSQAAQALHQVQTELKKSNLSLMVYDCYRPQMAVDEMVAWSKSADQKMKKRFYPHINNKQDLFKQGYIAAESGHSRGSTMDLTIVPIPMPHTETYVPGETLEDCTEPYLSRFQDGSIDMGTSFDCLDPLSSPFNQNIGVVPYYNRQMLQAMMKKYGFMPYDKEWWHFTLKNEPYPNTAFNFPIQ